MKKFFGGLIIVLSLGYFSGSAIAASIGYIEGTSGCCGNLTTVLSDYLIDRGDGSTTTAITPGTFNSLSAGDLLSTYDAILFPWFLPSSLTPDWNSVLLPYLQGGGGIVWEDPTNIGDIAGDAGFTQSVVSTVGTTVTVTASEPGLTDALVDALYVNNHMNFSALSADWTEWLVTVPLPQYSPNSVSDAS